MREQKQNDCVDLKNKIQRALYEKYKELTDEERESTINRKLSTSGSLIANFWQKNVLRVADERTKYKSK